MRQQALLLLTAGLLTSCSVGPNYHRPAVSVPPTFRAPEPLPADQAESIADLKWFDVFKDQQLQSLIRRALARNYDLRDAVTRVEQARAWRRDRPLQSIPAIRRQRSGGDRSHLP
ncbi:MAG: hypothetical protein WDO73_16845 [Ignavibacteriota bacterium]